jgi:hypothetical protein
LRRCQIFSINKILKRIAILRIFEVIGFSESEVKYDNWVTYTTNSLRDDFVEYKKKEDRKWKSRADRIGARWPIFSDIDQFKSDLEVAPIVKIDSLGNVENLTKNTSIDGIKSMVSSYQVSRDVERIISGFQSNAKIPLPIILKGSTGLWIMAGNTRQSTARVLGVTPVALLVDVSS